MFHNRYILLVLLSVSPETFACSVPITGEKYDSLISVNQDAEPMEIQYHITVPEYVESAKFDSAIIHILNTENKQELDVPVQMKSDSGKMTGYVFLYEDLSLNVEVSVWWDTGACPIIGTAILKHNKSLKNGTAQGAIP